MRRQDYITPVQVQANNNLKQAATNMVRSTSNQGVFNASGRTINPYERTHRPWSQPGQRQQYALNKPRALPGQQQTMTSRPAVPAGYPHTQQVQQTQQAQPQPQSSVYTGAEGGSVPVRQALNQLGIDNSRIGYNEATGNVTYNGNDWLKPSSVQDGVSYVDDKTFKDALGGMGNGNYVIANDWLAAHGYNIPYSYDDVNGLTIGGKNVNSTLIGDRSVMNENALRQLAEDYYRANGLKTNAQLANEYNTKYDQLQRKYDDLVNGTYKYDYASDPAYQALKRSIDENGRQAVIDTMAAVNDYNSGMINPMAIMQAAQKRNEYAKTLDSYIPQLEQQDFSRRENALDKAAEILAKQYGMDYTSFADQKNDTQNERAYNDNRADVAYNRAWDVDERDYNRNLQQTELQRQYSREDYENAVAHAAQRGYYTDEEADIVGVPHGTSFWNNELRYFDEVTAPLTEKQYQLALMYPGIAGGGSGSGGSGRSRSGRRSSGRSSGSSGSSGSDMTLSKNYSTKYTKAIGSINDDSEKYFDGSPAITQNANGSWSINKNYIGNGNENYIIGAIMSNDYLNTADKNKAIHDLGLDDKYADWLAENRVASRGQAIH